MKIHEYKNGTKGSELPAELLVKHEARGMEIVDMYFDGKPLLVIDTPESIERFKSLWQPHFGVPYPRNIRFGE